MRPPPSCRARWTYGQVVNLSALRLVLVKVNSQQRPVDGGCQVDDPFTGLGLGAINLTTPAAGGLVDANDA